MTIHHRYAILLPLVTSMFAVLFVFSSPAHAMVVRGGEAYVVASGTTMVGDLYYLGKTFTLTGTSTDDLIAFGSVLTIDGRVGGDVLAVGGRVTTGGTVHGDLRIVGGEISVASTTVGEDLVALGGTFIIDKGTIIKGDLLVYGDQLVMNGTVEGNVEAHVRAVEIRGTVGHDTNITARESVSVTDQAHLRGALLYTAPREAFIPDTVKVDGKTSFELTPETKDEGTLNLVPTLITLLVTIVAALMFVFLLTRLSVEMSSVALRDHGMLAIKGFVPHFSMS
jgi:cytoskeletal protein CcmA (bactofilin family)